MTSQTLPSQAAGLYDPRYEHDACGVGMVARLDNTPTHEVVTRALAALENLEHRGASGADPLTGDGAGILMQMPDELLRAVTDFELPAPGAYGVFMCFLPTDDEARARIEALFDRTVERARASGCSVGATCQSARSTPVPRLLPAAPGHSPAVRGRGDRHWRRPAQAGESPGATASTRTPSSASCT